MQVHRNFSSASTLFTLALAFLASPVNSLAGGAPPPNISPLTIEGASPTIWFDDTQDEDATPSWDWAIQTDGGTEDADNANTFQILDYDEGCVLGEKAPDTPNEVIVPCAIPVVTIESNGDGATADAIKVFGNGDVVLGGEDGLSVGAGSAFILAPDAVFPDVGGYPPYLHQWTPGAHVLFSPSQLALQAIYAFDTSVNPELESPNVAGSLWYAAGAGQSPLNIGSSVGLFDIVANTFPFTMETGTPDFSLFLTQEGTVSTVGKIHVGSQDTPVGQFTITSADQPRFELNDTTNNRRWRFSVTNTAFAINNLDEAGTEFKSFNNGDLEIGGALFENSDRNSKQDIVAVDHLSVLDRIVALPISEWSYKDAPNQRHIGPMAQDFHAAFGLGRNNTGISTLDTAGVALAGIKALKWQNDRLAAKTEKLAAENGKLAAENSDLRNRMAAMESRQAEIMVALATLRAQQDQPAPVMASTKP